VTDLPHEVTGGAVLEDRQETVTFGLDGQAYELDLGHKHALELRSALQPYIRAGRRVGKQPAAPARARRTPERQVPATGERPDTVAIRAWARAQGYQVSDRGRIPAEVLKSYEADKLASRSH
jgi:hypothetical protein